MLPCLFWVVLLISGVLKGWCEALCIAFACFALIRRWRATFPLKGEGFYARCETLGGTS